MSSVAERGTLDVLDFPLLMDSLAGWSQTPMGRARLDALEPSDDPDEIDERQAAIAEFREFLDGGGALSLAPAQPVGPALHDAAVVGTVLSYDDLIAVYRTAQVGGHARRRLAKLEQMPLLRAVGDRVPDLSPLIDQIETVFDDDGEVRDNASPELAAIRRDKQRARHKLQQTLDRLVKDSNLDGVLRDRLVTQRGGRYVVPVQAGKRGALPGVVHDTSSSGQTLYVEPLEIVDQQNAVVEIESSERDEIQRLLAALTGHVRAASEPLAATEEAIAILDARQAAARFADMMEATRPTITAGDTSLRGARHPLMIPGVLVDPDADEPESNGPVPLDLELGADTRALVITGPNTGGKTVVLKNVGLLSLMAQCGLPVPAEAAALPVRPRVHADIGDDQSIVASLSTFSAHLTRIKRFLDDAPAGSLVLLDELGTGTDPAEGSALGIAMLEYFSQLGATTIASTHHDALKAFAHATDGVVNAAMEFDSETLQPTYRLRLGRPGRSNAFDIAARLGLDPALVERARGLIDVDAAQLDSLIRSVEGEAEALASDREGVQQEQGRLAKAHARYEKLNAQLLELRETLAADGKAAIDEAVARVREEGDEMLAELADELGEARKSRAAQDRRGAWAARVGGADSGARRKIDKTVTEAARAATEASERAGMSRQRVSDELAASTEDLERAAADDPGASLTRGDAVVVMPLNLRGKVVRDWAEGGDDEVEVDIHGKRLVVSREQVRRLSS